MTVEIFYDQLHERMGPGRDRTHDPWICSQTRICCQTRYRLRYAARYNSSSNETFLYKVLCLIHPRLDSILEFCWTFLFSATLYAGMVTALALYLRLFTNVMQWF